MEKERLDLWRKAIATSEKFMAPKRRHWRRLLQHYKMDYESLGLPEGETVRFSLFYPLTRQIITTIAFTYPRLFFRVEDSEYQYGAEILERAANSALEVMRAKEEIQQTLFDALYCSLGWLKYGYNPPGNQDIELPYVTADALQNDMPYVRRISPFNMLPDPLTPPHRLSHGRYLIEKMLVPLEFVKKDDRFVNRKQIKPLDDPDTVERLLEDMEDQPFADSDEMTAIKEARKDGELVLLHEIHDRIHHRRITLAHGVEQPIEDIDHPFREVEAITTPDPFTGEPRLTGRYEYTGAYLMDGGFCYHAVKLDLSDESLYGIPIMGYVEDLQKGVVESVSRRMDLLKRTARILLGNQSEKEKNPDMSDLEEAKDGLILWVNDVNNSYRGLDWGQIPQDQLGVESDLRQYTEQTLQVSQLALGGGPRRTATEASLIASFGQMNREWLQDKVAEAYRVTARNTLRTMADPRYTPDNFLINVAQNDMDPVYQAVRADMLKVRFHVDIEAGSMQPLVEQLEQEKGLALFGYMIQIPEINRPEALRFLLRLFKVPNADKLIGPSADVEAVRSAQLENQIMAYRQQDPGVLPTQNHQVHLRTHQTAQQDPSIVAFLQQAQTMNPQIVPQFLALMQQHAQQHMMLLQQRAAGQAKQGGPGPGNGQAKTLPSLRDSAGGTNPLQQAQALQNTVRGNAQRVSQQVSMNPDQN